MDHDDVRGDDSHGADATARYGDDFAAQMVLGTGDLTPEEFEAVAALPVGSSLLIARRGPGAGSRFLIDIDVTTAGRHPDADIFLDDVTVSRRHAEFVRDAGHVLVRDLGSLNGTYVDGERIDEAVLTEGAEVQVGKFRLTWFASRHDLPTAAR
jgi:pSer/pThr/pTyr-binding forkhead associated (FHA) protein